jgi:hypothetical protein
MSTPVLFRRRFIPEELVALKDDIILARTEDRIVTQWKTLKPRADFARGRSVYFLREGFKISRYLNAEGACLYLYCDVFEYEYDRAGDVYCFSDLLIDVLVYPDGFVKVLDLAEVSLALTQGLITVAQAKLALDRAGRLLDIVYGGQLQDWTKYLDAQG